MTYRYCQYSIKWMVNIGTNDPSATILLVTPGDTNGDYIVDGSDYGTSACGSAPAVRRVPGQSLLPARGSSRLLEPPLQRP